MKTLVEFIRLPDFLSGQERLEGWLEGQHDRFDPNDALIHALYARFANDLKKPDEYPLLDRPFILDIAFKPKGEFSVFVEFGVLGIKRNTDKTPSEYDLIKVKLSEKDFANPTQRIYETIKAFNKTGFDYNQNLKIKIKFDKTREIKLIELINETEIEGRGDVTANIYAAKIRVKANIFEPFSSNLSKLSFEYNDVTYAKSRYSSFNYFPERGVLETSRVPTYLEHKEEKINFKFDFEYETLANCKIVDLEGLASDMCQKIDKKITDLKAQQQSKKFNASEARKERLDNELENDITKLEFEKNSIKDGIAIIKTDTQMYKAFKLLNKTFLLRHNFKKDVNKEWRSFQLLFILSQIPVLVNSEKSVTLINFPTGAGKTEAFLGLSLLKIFYERIKASNHGISVIIKYPRKLLSRQQVKRGIELISFANAAAFLDNDEKLLEHPISLGTLFNSEDTPNRYTGPETNYSKPTESFEKWVSDPYNRAIRMDGCPYCGHKIEIKGDEKELRIRFRCSNKNCIYNILKLTEFFERTDGEIPIYIGDDEVFRYHPSILITTIDKFSSFCAYNPNFKSLLLDPNKIRFDYKYGFYYIEKQFEKFPACRTQERRTINEMKKYFKCPTLFIFDEIHLVNGSYASKFSILEKAFMEIFNEDGSNPAKIVCSSATLKRTFNGEYFSYQLDFGNIFHVAPPKVVLYPAFWDIFVKKTDKISRVIKMVMPSNFSRYLAMEHISEYYLRNFKEIPDQDKPILSSPLYYFKSKARLERVRGSIGSRVIEKKFIGANRLPYKINQNIEFSTDIEQSEMSGFQTELDKKLASARVGIDLIFATNTIANGLDIDALNIILIFGFPNQISEYIQARSRIARRETTGICISVLEQRDIREASVFYDFYDMHENIALAIEGNPVNLEARGVLQNIVKKLFHLAVQLVYDKPEKPFYRVDRMMSILSDDNLLDPIEERVYSWLDFEKSDENVKNFKEEIWKPYISGYKKWLEKPGIRTIYDDKKNRFLPQPSLLDISPFVNVKLSNDEAEIAGNLHTASTEIDEQPNEEGDDMEESDKNAESIR